MGNPHDLKLNDNLTSTQWFFTSIYLIMCMICKECWLGVIVIIGPCTSPKGRFES